MPFDFQLKEVLLEDLANGQLWLSSLLVVLVYIKHGFRDLDKDLLGYVDDLLGFSVVELILVEALTGIISVLYVPRS